MHFEYFWIAPEDKCLRDWVIVETTSRQIINSACTHSVTQKYRWKSTMTIKWFAAFAKTNFSHLKLSIWTFNTIVCVHTCMQMGSYTVLVPLRTRDCGTFWSDNNKLGSDSGCKNCKTSSWSSKRFKCEKDFPVYCLKYHCPKNKINLLSLKESLLLHMYKQRQVVGH